MPSVFVCFVQMLLQGDRIGVVVQYMKEHASCFAGEETQRKIVHLLRNYKYSPRRSLLCGVLKELISLVAVHDEELEDDLISYYTSLMSKPTSSSGFYKTFIALEDEDTPEDVDVLTRNRNIVIPASEMIISNGTTGLSVWPASLALSEWTVNS